MVKYVVGERGYVAVALLGGVYSSTVTVLSLARMVGGRQLAGLSLIACGAMYLRIFVLLAMAGSELTSKVGIWLVILGVSTGAAGLLLGKGQQTAGKADTQPGNPLDLRVAVFFVFLYGLFTFLGGVLSKVLNQKGLAIASALGGAVDVNPVIMAVAQGSWAVEGDVLASMVFFACAANNIVKGLIPVMRRGRGEGSVALCALLVPAVLTAIIAFAFYLRGA